MPTQLSKFFIDASCKEFSHPTVDSCLSATAGLGLNTFEECLRLYTTVYVATLLLRGKIPSIYDITKTVLCILQSSAFLTWSGFSYSMFICWIRQLMRFNVLTVSFLPSFLSSLSAIIIERPSRRPMLALYVSNIASETVFKMGVWRGYFSPVPHGETYIFAASIALLIYYFRSKENKADSIYKIIRVILGKYEETDYQKKEQARAVSHPVVTLDHCHEKGDKGPHKKSSKHKFNIFFKSLQAYRQIIERLKGRSKHVSCPHPHSCAHYTLTGAGKLFTYGLCGQLALKLVFQFRKLFTHPQALKNAIFKRENLNLAVFLGGFSGLYRLTSCLLRRFYDKDSENYAIPAGLVASVSFLAYSDNTIALYFMWKALQLLWNDMAERGIVPEVEWFVIFLYSFSTAILFHAAIFEPQNLRPSYWKFLHKLSGGRIACMSRIPIDEFGLETSKYLKMVVQKTKTTDKDLYPL